MAIAATAARSVALTLVAPTPAAPQKPDLAVRIHADDPVTRLGLRAQFEQVGVPIDDTDGADVTVLVRDRFDEQARQELTGIVGDGPASPPVLLVLTELDADAALAAMGVGARGVLRRRDLDPQRLRAAVCGAAAGEVTFPVDLFTRMTNPAVRAASVTVREPARRAGISDRERDVLRLIADGNSTREVAEQLSYSERTIKNVLQELSVRLDLRNRTHVVSHAIRRGWI